MQYTHNLVPAAPPEWVNTKECLIPFTSFSLADLANLGWLPLIRDTEDAPLGYAAPVLEHRASVVIDDTTYTDIDIAVQYAIGTAEERIAETLRQWRVSASVDAWQARYILTSIPALVSGPLAVFPDATLLNQIDAFVAANLPPPALEKFRGAQLWYRNDPMLLELASLAGLSEVDIDNWFKAASQVA